MQVQRETQILRAYEDEILESSEITSFNELRYQIWQISWVRW